jgi:uncharacterized protein (DUF1800 family)
MTNGTPENHSRQELPYSTVRVHAAHFDAATSVEIGFAERLVWFGSNHFCVNADDTADDTDGRWL